MVLATGIASIWARDAMAMRAGQLTVAEAFPDRFLLGLGVSHQPMVDFVRGGKYDKPLTAMREYLEKMDAAVYMARPPGRGAAPRPRRPRTEDAAARRGQGPGRPLLLRARRAHRVRGEVLGEGPMLCPEQAVVLDTDPDQARAAARLHMATYLGLPNYTNNLRRFGWGDDDLADGGSDELVDAIVAWGDEEAIAERVRAHHEAGADHVCLQVLSNDATALPLPQWRRLANALLDG